MTAMALTDENAFGVFVLLYDIADLEYGSEPEAFVETFTQFRELLLARAHEQPFGAGLTALDLGHAVYFEIGDGDHSVDPILWAKSLCGPLLEAGFQLSAILTHGGRWIGPEARSFPEVGHSENGSRVLRVSHPSEPFQRALVASAHCHTSDAEDDWGQGLYVDTEAIEALGKTPKNQPTLLESAGATFYRLGLTLPARAPT